MCRETSVKKKKGQRSCSFFLSQFLFEYSYFIILCYYNMYSTVLLYSRVNQLYVYIYPFFFGSPSHLAHHRAFTRVP